MMSSCSQQPAGRGADNRRMRPALVLIHSPFLGPAVWSSTAAALRGRGRRVTVPSLLVVARSAPPYWPAGVEAIIRSAAEDPVVLVAHSNGGLYVPAVMEALGDQVRGVVFTDAALPGIGHYTPPAFVSSLPVVDGLLPPWTSWWDEADVAGLFPSPDVRAEVEAEQPRMPLAYFDHLPPVPQGWGASPGGYIWFGPPYDQGAALASEHGWPTEHLPGGHLHMLTDPDAVAESLVRLAGGWS
jgi:pimeloyl-ACP methyl ester carboxylesterase